MADKIFHSTAVTFVDMTDSRTLDVYIASNHPTVQIYDSNKTMSKYTPDWSETNLELKASFYLDSQSITPNSIKWYVKVGTTKSELTNFKNNNTLLITTNSLSSSPIITYICEATYDTLVAFKEITFARVDTGKNGADGTSVNIKGTATSANLDKETGYYTITYANNALTLAQEGDAYVYNGDLYVCVGLQAGDGTDYFINVGRIQGPAGQNAKNIILSGESQVFKANTLNTTTPSTIKVVATAFNTSITTWAYSTDGGQTFKDVVAGVSRADNIVTVTGSSLTTNSLVIKASDGSVEDIFTIYKAFDGANGSKGADGQSASMAFLTNENATLSANASGVITSATITTNVVAYNGTTKATPTIGTISNLPTGMTVAIGTTTNNEIPIVFTITNSNLGSTSNNNGSITIPIISPVNTNLVLTWSKVNSGPQGPQGNKGNDSYTVLLTNESHVFAGDVSNAVDGSTTTQVLAYNGSTAQTVTISSVNGKTAAITDTDTGIAGLKFKCSALSGTSPTITFTCTTAFTSANGSIPIVLSVGGIQFTKMFTYSIAFKGNTGGTGAQGPQGTAATSYWLVSSASAVQKTSTGTITVTPSTLTFTGKAQTGTNTPIDYACRWIIDSSTDGVAYTNLHTSTTNEASKSITVTTTYKTIRARMYMAGGTTALLDEQIIPIVSDGAPGTSASLVDITPSAYFFKSTTGKDGVFTPDYIYLYPRFQTVTYSKWQYYSDSTSSWIDVVSGSNGLTIGTYNSTANSLQIAKGSSLYTDSITSVSFRCVSSNATVYDTVSIAKIYDVIDLQIGGRNLAEKTNQGKLNWGWAMQVGGATLSDYVDTDGVKCCKFIRDSVVYSGWSYLRFESIKPQKYMPNTEYTVSFEVYSSVDTIFGVRLMEGNANNDMCVTYNTVSKNAYKDKWSKIICYCKTKETMPDLLNQILYLSNMNSDPGTSYIIKNVKIEKGNKATDWTPAPEDLINEASNVNVMLSNEAHFFAANASGIPTATSIVLDVFGYKGSIQSATTVGTITGLPSAGMTATIASNNTTSTKITISVTSSLTSDVADSGVLTIPVTVNGHTINKKFSWSKSKEGAVGTPGVDAVTFRIYSTEGYILSTNTPSITLQTFAYVGDVAITAGATYQWYFYNNGAWTAITGSTNNYVSIARDDVSFSNGYMCKMMFGGVEYVDVVTIEDKSDNNQVFVSKPSNYSIGDIWIVSRDYIPPKMAEGVLLKAVNANKTYADADWITATAYDSRMQKLENDISTYNNYFDFDTAYGIKITAKDEDGNVSPFSTTLSHTRLSFNQGAEAVAYIESNKMKIKEAEIESPLSVTGKKVDGTVIQYPVINLGNFSLIVESNGSLSIIANT